MTRPHISEDGSLSIEEYTFLREKIRDQDNLIRARLSWLVMDVASYLTIWAAISRMRNIRHLAGKPHPSRLPTVQAEIDHRAPIGFSRTGSDTARIFHS
jgi:hypothetical protein